MKNSRMLAALLCGALISASAVMPGSLSVQAEQYSPEDGLIAVYDFDQENLINGIDAQTQAEALVTGLDKYSGDLTYESGNGGNGKALRLGEYGLKLNQENIGDDFTVSMWIKPDGGFGWNEAVLMMGHHDPEKWLAVSGVDYENPNPKIKFWANGSGNGNTCQWEEFQELELGQEWHCLTIVGSNTGVLLYIDGEVVARGESIAPLTGENQDIYIGVSYWDTEFKGVVDDIKVYNRALSETEAAQLFNPDIAQGETKDPENAEQDLLAYFEFENNLGNSVEEETEAEAVLTGLDQYSGTVKYKKGYRGNAIQLGEYGLKLNQTNVGDDFTVSMWVNADSRQLANQCMLFLGYHDPEKWFAVSGTGKGSGARSANYKFWLNGNGYTWSTVYEQMIQPEEWHQLTVTATPGKIKIYIDGIFCGEKSGNDPLSGDKQDIYIGVNNWDNEFEGLVDDVKVYRIALTEQQVQAQAKDDFQRLLEERAEQGFTLKEILGENISKDEIKTNLVLPEQIAGLNVKWNSDNKAVISVDGNVKIPEKNTKVNITGTIAYGDLKVSKTFEMTVLAVDTSDLERLIGEAKELDKTNLTNASAERLQKTIAEAENVLKVPTFEEIDSAYKNLNQAMTELFYKEEINPFLELEEPEKQIQLKVGSEEKIFDIPDTVKDMVTVTYSSENEEIATYNDGIITAKGSGKTIVTATVISEALDIRMEYSTGVDSISDEPAAHKHTVSKIEKKLPTCTATGNIAYWYCEECGKYFGDAEATIEITEKDIVIPMKGHEWEKDYTIDREASATESGIKSIHCKNCNAVTDRREIPATGEIGKADSGNNSKAPETGDTTKTGVTLFMMLIAMTAIIIFVPGRKKK